MPQNLAERLGRIYESNTFGTGGYRGAARFHQSVAKSNLAIDCKLSYVDIPVRVPGENGMDDYAEIVQWPVLLPYDLAVALLDQGLETILMGDAKERQEYWENIVKDFPQMHGIQTESSAPLAMYGDEGSVWRQSVMLLHWEASLNPLRTNSLGSRFLMTTIPSEKYWVDA